MVEYYIKSLNKMVCNKCLLRDYKVQVGESIPIDIERLDSYVKSSLKTLEDHSQKVNTLINTINGLS